VVEGGKEGGWGRRRVGVRKKVARSSVPGPLLIRGQREKKSEKTKKRGFEHRLGCGQKEKKAPG